MNEPVTIVCNDDACTDNSRGDVVKVLMIEDEMEIIESLSLVFQLRWPGTTLLFTHQGRRGVEMVNSEDPDVVILDLGLPDICGLEVLQQIRSVSSVPVVILTAMSEDWTRVKGLEYGADAFMTKPFKQSELMNRLQTLARG